MKKTLLRKSFPKVRIVVIKGIERYQTDSRRKGGGTRETFSTAEEALERARKIAAEFEEHGTGSILPFQLRASALRCHERLGKFGKSLEDATDFYIKHLEAEASRASSATITTLADAWFKDKSSGGLKKLRQDTLDDIEETGTLLKRLFPTQRIAEVTQKDIESYLDGLTVSLRRKHNRRNLLGQFFNWSRKRGYTNFNPCEGIEIEVPATDVQILTVEESELLVRLTETPEFEDLQAYVVIALFAGLRPTECQKLRWEQVDLEEGQITVLNSTTKVKETRCFAIEPTLVHWLTPIAKKTGLVTKPVNFRPRFEKLKAKAGYRISGENPHGKTWIDDGLRHTFASFWLAKHQDRPHLAERMGTSLKMIKAHYKTVVARSKMEAFWNILPKAAAEEEERELAEITAAF